MKPSRHIKMACILISASLLLVFAKYKPGLKGKIRSFTHMEYEVIWDSNSPTIRLSSKEHVLYDTNGNFILSENYYGSDSNWLNKTICQYDKKGLLIERKYYNWFGHDSILINQITYSFDSLGHRQEKKLYNNNIGSFETIKTADRIFDSAVKVPFNGKLINVDTIKKSRISYQYDTSGQINEQLVYLPDGKLDRKFIYVRDNLGVAIVYEYKDDTLIGNLRERQIYDRIGNCIIDSIYNNDTLTRISRQEFEYY